MLDHGKYVKQGKKEPVERSLDGESFAEVLPGEKTSMLAREFTFDNTVNKVPHFLNQGSLICPL